MEMKWVNIKDIKIPFEGIDKGILIAHKYGVEYVFWTAGIFKYCYSGKPVDQQVLDSMSHLCIPYNPNKI